MLSGGNHLNRVPPDPEGSPGKFQLVPFVLNIGQRAEQAAPLNPHARAEAQHLPLVFAGVAHGIDAADGCHDDDILPLAQRRGGAVAHPVNLVVDGGVLLDIGIRGGDVGLRLIIVVVADKVFHPAVREESLQLGAQLGGQGLVVRDHQRRHLHLLDHRGHREGLSAAGDAQQDLILHFLPHSPGQRFNRFRLIPGGLIGSL